MLERLRHQAAASGTGVIEVTIEQLNEIHYGQQATIADLQGQHALANERAKVWETQATNMQAVNAERCTELERAQQRVAQLDGEKQELEQLFDLQHTRTVEADKLWQQAHNRPDLWPDLGQLVGWLMSRYDSLQADHARVLGLVQEAVIQIEQVEGELHAALNGTRHDPSWIRPIQLSRNERQELYLSCEAQLKAIRASLLCQEKQRLALPMPKLTVLEPFGEKAYRFIIHYDGGHPGCKVVIESADGALDAIAELLTDEYRKQSSLPAQRAKLAQGGDMNDALDAKRYRRLQVLGCAPSTSKQLENGTVLCFTNLDEFVDADIKAVPSRGEAQEGV